MLQPQLAAVTGGTAHSLTVPRAELQSGDRRAPALSRGARSHPHAAALTHAAHLELLLACLALNAQPQIPELMMKSEILKCLSPTYPTLQRCRLDDMAHTSDQSPRSRLLTQHPQIM